jgi:hypothetical protein
MSLIDPVAVPAPIAGSGLIGVIELMLLWALIAHHRPGAAVVTNL